MLTCVVALSAVSVEAVVEIESVLRIYAVLGGGSPHLALEFLVFAASSSLSCAAFGTGDGVVGNSLFEVVGAPVPGHFVGEEVRSLDVGPLPLGGDRCGLSLGLRGCFATSFVDTVLGQGGQHNTAAVVGASHAGLIYLERAMCTVAVGGRKGATALVGTGYRIAALFRLVMFRFMLMFLLIIGTLGTFELFFFMGVLRWLVAVPSRCFGRGCTGGGGAAPDRLPSAAAVVGRRVQLLGRHGR